MTLITPQRTYPRHVPSVDAAVDAIIKAAEEGTSVRVAAAALVRALPPETHPELLRVALVSLANDRMTRNRYATPDAERPPEDDLLPGVRSGHKAAKRPHAAKEYWSRLDRLYESVDGGLKPLRAFGVEDWQLLRRKSESQVRTWLSLRKAARLAVQLLTDGQTTADLSEDQQRQIAEALP